VNSVIVWAGMKKKPFAWRHRFKFFEAQSILWATFLL
jgi:hypothetical protein